jgi:uncharacterized membrane protein
MYALVANLRARALVRELPAFGVSLLIADRLFHFHSFALECAAFLVVWGALGWITNLVLSRGSEGEKKVQ